ncbi:MAG: 4-phosphoerythronate dehydrogenase [Muribaculaceae bacterium]|nr:4-phosphoerythronate dehydrogenase [Muribaculaceae bacterium]
MKPRIVYDEKVPYVAEVLGDKCELVALPAGEITRESAADADGLIIRTRTRADRNLLEGARCKIVATATIGMDHIDREWCERAGIRVANAPGCNAPAVAQWVFAAIASITDRPESRVLGVVGAGHVGSIVAKWGESMGMKVLVCDPPRARKEGSEGFCDLATIAEKADIITFHTPLTKEGEDATYHLAGERFFNALRRKPYILNAARGPVTDTRAMLDALDNGKIAGVMIDCWEGEPEIDRELLERAIVATPHIAGYSLEGKIRATAMAAREIGKVLLPEDNAETDMSHIARDADGRWINVPQGAADGVTMRSVAESYDIAADTARLKRSPEEFENLRNNYALRHEVK